MTNILVLLTLCTSLVLGQVDELVSDTDMATALVERAKTFARIGDWENGIKYLESYILMRPEDAEARLLLAECYFNWPDKQTVGEQVVDKNQERGRTQIEILARLGDAGFEMLLKALGSSTSRVYSTCFSVLGAKRDRRAIDRLITVAREEPKKASSVIHTLVDIERDRDRVDDRVVKLLISILEKPESAVRTRTAAAQAVASLRVREAAATLNKELNRVIAALPTSRERDDRDLLREGVNLVDAVARTVPADLNKHVTPVLNKMEWKQRVDFFEAARDQMRHLGIETLAFLTKTALATVRADPAITSLSYPQRAPRVSRLGRNPVETFLLEMSSDYPTVMLQGDIKELLHELCEHPQREVRLAVIGIVGKIRDEDALPILLPRVRASWMPRGSPDHMFGAFFRSSRGPTVGRRAGSRFGWGSMEPGKTWDAIKQIGSPRTSEFLLENLESDDMAWVYTAALLLMDIGEGRAIEPLKKMYSENSGTEDEKVKQVLDAIERAYTELSGRSLTEPDV